MDEQKKLHKKFLSCSICTYITKDPCTIDCCHTFCRACLTTFTNTRRDAITAKSILCPNCNQMTKVPRPQEPVDQWCQQFKPSFLTQALLGTFTSQEGSGEDTSDNCFTCKQTGDQTRATRACGDCDLVLCDRCTKIHTSTPSSAHHETSPIPGNCEPHQSREVMCTEHNCVEEFCCRDCNQAACSKCCVLYHRKCDSVVTIVSMIPEMKEVIQKHHGQLNSSLLQIKCNLENKQSQGDKNDTHKSALQAEIRRLSQDAVDVIKHKEKQLLAELDAVAEKQEGQLKDQIQSGEVDMEACEKCTEFVSHVLQSSKPMDLLQMFLMCQSGAITGAATRLSSIGEHAPPVSLQKDLDVSEMDKSFNLGFLVSDFMFSCPPKKKSELCIKSDLDRSAPNLCDIALLEVYGIEVMAVTDTSNNQIKSLFNAGGRLYIKSLKLNQCGPLNMAKFSSTNVLVSFTSHRGIHQIKFTPAPVYIGYISTTKNYTCLASLGDMSLAAGCASPPSIDVLDLSGRVLKTVISPSRVKELVQGFWYMCSTRQGNIVVTDGLLGSVYCLTQQGDVVYKRQLTKGPSGLCGGAAVANTGSVLVVDHHGNKIVQLTETGEYVRDLLTDRDGIDRPRGIWLKRNHVYVVMQGGVVKVFEFSL